MNRPNRSPQRDRLEKTVTTTTATRVVPHRHLDRQWSACSLCSVDSIDMDDLLPIPGRESHTGDMAQFMSYIRRLGMIKRFEGDPPFSLPFWLFIKNVLDEAKPVGYTELQDTEAVERKTASDNIAFLQKIEATSIINPIDPGALAEKTGLSIDDVLTELFYATQMDMLRMRWFPDCELLNPSCSSKRPKKKKTAYCNGCKYRNAIAVLKKIKVVFCFNPDIFFALAEIPSHVHLDPTDCELLAIVPATFTGSGYRYSLGADDDNDGSKANANTQIRAALNPGRYTIQCPIVAMVSTFLHVEREATKEDEPHVLRIHVSDILQRPGRRSKTHAVPHGKIHLDIFTDTQAFFICKLQKVEEGTPPTTTESPMGMPSRQSTTVNNNNNKNSIPFTHAQKVMDHPTYIQLFEGTEVETFHFNSAVKKMSLEPMKPPSTPCTDKPSPVMEKELISSMKNLSCVAFNTNSTNNSVVEDGSIIASI